MKKNLLVFLLALLAPVMARADTITAQIDGVWYELYDDGTAAVADQFANTPVEGTPSSQYYGLSGDVVIPESVTYVDEETEEETTYAVTALAYEAFHNQWGVTSITIPETITSINNVDDGYLFSNCYAKTITMPERLLAPKVPSHTFNNCRYLTNVYLSNGDDELIDLCESEAITELGDYAFYYCAKYDNLSIPVNVTSIGGYCYAYSDIAAVNLPEGVTELKDNCFSACNYLRTVELPDRITSIGASCFSYCQLLTSVTLPAGITELPNTCFRECTRLASIVIPEGVTSVGNWCFYKCTSLTSIVFSSTVEKLVTPCAYCSALKSVTCRAAEPPSLSYPATTSDMLLCFPNDLEDCVLYVPESCISAYADEDCRWSGYFPVIKAMPYELTVTPADGKQVENITGVTVNWYAGLALSSDDAYEDITLQNEDGETAATIVSAELSDDGATYTLTFSEPFYVHSPVFPAGKYTLNIPEGVFILSTLGEEGVANEEMNISYTLTGDEPVPTLGFDPAPVDENGEGGTVEELHVINISVVDGLSLVRKSLGFPARITLTNADGEQVTKGSTCEGDDDSANDDGTFTTYVLTLVDTITDPGEYTLYVPAATFTFTHGTGDTSDNEATYVTFVIPDNEESNGGGNEEGNDDDTTGISGVASTANSDVVEIYNLAGQKIAAPIRGQVNIIRTADGMIKKVLTK